MSIVLIAMKQDIYYIEVEHKLTLWHIYFDAVLLPRESLVFGTALYDTLDRFSCQWIFQKLVSMPWIENEKERMHHLQFHLSQIWER
jgi:hypothetical protein